MCLRKGINRSPDLAKAPMTTSFHTNRVHLTKDLKDIARDTEGEFGRGFEEREASKEKVENISMGKHSKLSHINMSRICNCPLFCFANKSFSKFGEHEPREFCFLLKI